MMKVVKTTIVGGLVFLLPAALVLLVLSKSVTAARALAAPLSDKLPHVTLFGLGTATLVAVLLLLLVCFTAGIFARTSLGEKMKSRVDNSIVSSIPAYQILKSMAEGMEAIESSANVHAALARIEDAWQPALVLEKLDNGLLTVFVPQVPNPMSGSVFYLTSERVKMLDVPISRILICIKKMGLGSQALFCERTDLT